MSMFYGYQKHSHTARMSNDFVITSLERNIFIKCIIIKQKKNTFLFMIFGKTIFHLYKFSKKKTAKNLYWLDFIQLNSNFLS